MGLLQKVRNVMLGAEYDEDEMYVEDYVEEEEEEVEEAPRVTRDKDKNRDRDKDLRAYRKSRESSSNNVVNLPTSNSYPEHNRIIIACPQIVNDATAICEHLKNDIICVVDLNGVERNNAQRIADFLGGATYTLGGDMQRISDEIFLVVPQTVDISSDIKQELKENGIIFPWIQSAFK